MSDGMKCEVAFGWYSAPIICDRPFGHPGSHAAEFTTTRGARSASDEARTMAVFRHALETGGVRRAAERDAALKVVESARAVDALKLDVCIDDLQAVIDLRMTLREYDAVVKRDE